MITVDSFWAGSWQHIIFGEFSTDGKGNRPLIRHLCYGPLETREYGITADGSFYYEEHIIEGVGAGGKIFEIISLDEFLRAADNEAKLCEKYAPPLAEQLSEIREKICRGIPQMISDKERGSC